MKSTKTTLPKEKNLMTYNHLTINERDCIYQFLKLNISIRAFGHGIGFAIGLMLIPVVFILILGYGKSEYKGADL